MYISCPLFKHETYDSILRTVLGGCHWTVAFRFLLLASLTKALLLSVTCVFHCHTGNRWLSRACRGCWGLGFDPKDSGRTRCAGFVTCLFLFSEQQYNHDTEERSCWPSRTGRGGDFLPQHHNLPLCGDAAWTQTACEKLLNIREDKGDISILDAGLAPSPGDRPASDWELTLDKAPQ